VVFLENDGGCFVTQVSPVGSAARSGGVEVGDQLAAINGTSSIRMDVDGICTAISNAPDKKCVEMMFVRYQGPLRPTAATSLGSGPTSSDHETIIRIKQPQKKEKEKKGMGRWFGRGKNK
jgi:predicted metalloprotease with PDZ domain